MISDESGSGVCVCFVFVLVICCVFRSIPQSPAQYSQIEQDALKLANEIQAEYWAVSSLTGECLDLDCPHESCLGINERYSLPESQTWLSACLIDSNAVKSRFTWI